MKARDILLESTLPALTLEGEARPELSVDLDHLEVDADTEGLSRLVLVLTAVGPRRGERDESLNHLDGRTIDFGKRIEVAMGPVSAAATVFSGRISAIEFTAEQGRPPRVTVRAEDALLPLRTARRFATYEDATLADVAEAIAAHHGLSAEVDVDAPRREMIQQWNRTDLAFLREEAVRLGAEIWVEGQTLHVATRDRRRAGAPRVTLVQGNDLLALHVAADLSAQRSRLTVGGYDEEAKDTIAETAEGDIAAGEADGRRTGPELLGDTLGEVATFRALDVPVTSGEAAAYARAHLLARARRFVTARGLTNGTPELRVGAELELQRVAPPFDGAGYMVTSTCHAFSRTEGYRTRFTAERPGLGGTA